MTQPARPTDAANQRSMASKDTGRTDIQRSTGVTGTERTDIGRSTGSTGTGRTDVRTAWRWTAALVLPIGPAAVALLRYLLPYNTTDDAPTIVDKIVGNLDRSSLVLWLAYVAILTLVPGAYFVGRLTRRGTPWLTGIALFLMVPGYLSLPWTASSDVFTWSAGTAGLDPAMITKAAEATHGSTDVAGLVFVVGHVIGTVLLGIAIWRSRIVGRWAALAVAVSQPVHFVAAVVVSSHLLDLIGWGLQAVGFAAVGWAILRMRDDEWQPSS
ncbi:hypothetical protein PWY87_10565 [Kribbella solani]|uniref:hypothetical protein n=1 Tax=Kribbella solani TaxID=236067 RepID=UPI0029A73375|nr:hypothetical protein [Kribbella solani]MDX3002114.1 hypothetical protein [Kribbella solani]